MRASERPERKPAAIQTWGSDPIAGLLRAMGIEYVALTPGASFRGLHDSLVNYLGNTRPEMLLAVHEESAVAIAHGYAKVAGKPMAVALHSNVGLMHATMAIFNAWCDRAPVLLLGAVGPLDALHRRPWVDWIHTSRDLGSLVRGYTKWDDQPASVPAALEAILRARLIATTHPPGPVFVCLDAMLQEQAIDGAVELPPVERFGAADQPEPAASSLERGAAILRKARRPIILMGRMSTDPADWARRITLAERLNAPVVTDLKWGAVFPTGHALHPFPPALYINSDAHEAIREADTILSMDWIDLAGTLRQANHGELPRGTVIHCSVDQYCHGGWNMDYQGLPPVDVSILAPPDRVVRKLLDMLGPGTGGAGSWVRQGVPAAARAHAPSEPAAAPGVITVDALARCCSDALVGHRATFVRLPIGWPGEYCRFEHPLDFLGCDGGGGIGAGPGLAVGAALALRGSDRLPVAILGDGDFLMGVTAVWTAVHYRIPLLIVIANNQSFFNDELHQERVARLRDRPVKNRWVGMRMTEPAFDLAMLARGQGAAGLGPIASHTELTPAMKEAIAQVRGGAVCVVDVRVAAEYARATSVALMRGAPAAR